MSASSLPQTPEPPDDDADVIGECGYCHETKPLVAEMEISASRAGEDARIAFERTALMSNDALAEPLHGTYDGLTDAECLERIGRLLDVANQRGDSLGWSAVRELIVDLNAVADRLRSGSVASSPETTTPPDIEKLLDQYVAIFGRWSTCSTLYAGNPGECLSLFHEAKRAKTNIVAAFSEAYRLRDVSMTKFIDVSARLHFSEEALRGLVPPVEAPTENVPSESTSDLCYICGKAEWLHTGPERFCSIYATFLRSALSAASPTAGDTERPRLRPIVVASDGVLRFKGNVACRWLIDEGDRLGLAFMNSLATVEMSADDRMEFAQLIGYSVDGYSELSYVTDESSEAAEREAENIRKTVLAIDAARGGSTEPTPQAP